MTTRRLSIGLHENIPDAEYHADPCERPSLSHSIACVLLAKSEAHARLAHPRLSAVGRDEDEVPEGDESEEEDRTGVRARGSLIHHLVLGGGAEYEVVKKTDAKTGEVTDATDYRSKSAQDDKAAILASGRTPVIASKLRVAEKSAGKIRARITVPPRTELTAVWESMGVLCRARFDGLFEGGRLWDLKTTYSALAGSSGTNVLKYGLDVQEAAYTDAIESLHPELVGRVPPMEFLFAEMSGDCEVITCILDAELREMGRRKWKRAKERWAACLASGVWPGYGKRIVTIECPVWAQAKEMEEAARAIPDGGSPGVTF